MHATLQNIGVFFVILHKLGTKKVLFWANHTTKFLHLMVDMVLMLVDMVLVVVVVVDMVVEDHEELTRKGGVI